MATVLRHLPNVITVARIVACVPLVWCIARGRAHDALVLAVAVGLSDVLDGFLARRFGWQSRIGGLLDPVADKLFLVSALVTLGFVGAVPLWLIVLVMVRDLVIVAGAFAYDHYVEPVPPAPSWPGKASTMAQVLLVLAVLAGMAGYPVPAPAIDALVIAVAVLAVASGLHYVFTWSARARAVWQRERP